jgi:hypothetical protein
MPAEDHQKPFTCPPMFVLGGHATTPDEAGQRIVGTSLPVLMDARCEPMRFSLPDPGEGSRWELAGYTAGDDAPPRPFGAAARSPRCSRRREGPTPTATPHRPAPRRLALIGAVR